MEGKLKKPIFTPLVESDRSIPSDFLPFHSISINRSVKREPGIWYTRGYKAHYDREKGAVAVSGQDRRLFVDAFETIVPKGYFSNRKNFRLKYRGKGWFSVKIVESTVTEGGYRVEPWGGWKKLDTVREVETVSFTDSEIKTREFSIYQMYNKPINVSWEAFLKGFKRLNRENIVQLEITVRRGDFLFYALEIF